ncbi:UNVERIFIED_CONTAM: hypothetical protein FKN15_035738 [Acipenser sinensis]
MRSHYKYCRLYKEEYGAPPATPVESRAQGIYAGITQATASDGLLSGNSAQPQATENGSLETTFMCPYCHQSGFTDMALVQHCNFNHFRDLTRVNIHQDEDEQLQAAIHVSIEEWNASSLWITC